MMNLMMERRARKESGRGRGGGGGGKKKGAGLKKGKRESSCHMRRRIHVTCSVPNVRQLVKVRQIRL